MTERRTRDGWPTCRQAAHLAAGRLPPARRSSYRRHGVDRARLRLDGELLCGRDVADLDEAAVGRLLPTAVVDIFPSSFDTALAVVERRSVDRRQGRWRVGQRWGAGGHGAHPLVLCLYSCNLRTSLARVISRTGGVVSPLCAPSLCALLQA